jgi:hypothetical protein
MTTSSTSNDHVLPRPVEVLPTYAKADARRNLAEKLVTVFGMSEAAADAISNAVLDPTSVRKTIGDSKEPQVEEIAVPGGMLLGIRTSVWSRRIMPDPRNPRIGPSRRHPFAIDPGTGGEDSRFRPVPEPRTPEGKPEIVPELVVEIDSRLHLEWASARAAKYVLEENDWRESIKSQGVMEAVWLVPTDYIHADGSATATVLTTVEGSSRTAAVHDILGVRSSDVPYEDPDRKLRALYKVLNEALEQKKATPEQTIALRCERMPALILVGFRPIAASTAGFPTAVKSLVALRHVDPPKPWGEGPAKESLADEVLDELFRRKLITATERSYYAGSITRAEAKNAHLSDCPACRAARIVALFAKKADDPTREATRIAVTSQSTRERITKNLCNELATALIMRSVASVADDRAKRDRVRRYMRHSFGLAVYNEPWECTGRDTDALAKEALREVQCAIGDEKIVEPGPASLELAVRAAYPLVITGGLNADRGSRGNNQSDRRHPGEVLDAMRRRVHGVHQLAQALRDFNAGQQLIRAVDENGEIKKRSDGGADLFVNDAYLRQEFPPPGQARARSGGSTPTEQLKDRLTDLSEVMSRLEEAFKSVQTVLSSDGIPLVEVDGVEPQFCKNRRQLLSQIGDELNIWDRIYRRQHGTPAAPILDEDGDDEDDDEGTLDDEDEEADDASYTNSDHAKAGTDSEASAQ